MEQPSISVIIPTLNAAAVLEGCLRSIAVQDYPKDLVEIIVADGGSTDGTLEIAKFAKVKVGIVHLFCGSNIGKFARKQKRRVRDFLYHQKVGDRSYPWQRQNKAGLAKFMLSCVTVFPLFYQSLKGYLGKPDAAWFFHPLACGITLLVYGWGQG